MADNLLSVKLLFELVLSCTSRRDQPNTSYLA